MSNLTQFQESLLQAIARRGTVRGLWRLAMEEEMEYHYCHSCLSVLEETGNIQVTRNGPGSPLIIAAAKFEGGASHNNGKSHSANRNGGSHE